MINLVKIVSIILVYYCCTVPSNLPLSETLVCVKRDASKIQRILLYVEEVIVSGDTCYIKLKKDKSHQLNESLKLENGKELLRNVYIHFNNSEGDSGNYIKMGIEYNYTIDEFTTLQQRRAILLNKKLVKRSLSKEPGRPQIPLHAVFQTMLKTKIADKPVSYSMTKHSTGINLSNLLSVNNLGDTKCDVQKCQKDGIMEDAAVHLIDKTLDFENSTSEVDIESPEEAMRAEKYKNLNSDYLSSEWNDIDVPNEREYSRGSIFGWGEPPEEEVYEPPVSGGNYFGPGPTTRDYDE